MSYSDTLDAAPLDTASFRPRRTSARSVASRWRVPLVVSAVLLLVETVRLGVVFGTMPSEARGDELCRNRGASFIVLSPEPLRWAVTCARPSGTRFTMFVPVLG